MLHYNPNGTSSDAVLCRSVQAIMVILAGYDTTANALSESSSSFPKDS